MSKEALFCAIRPDKTPVWLPLAVLRKIGALVGKPLTPEQFAHPEVQDILAERLAKEGKPKEKT